MQAVLGVIFHFIGGFASGSFYVPFKRVRGWAWENYWIIGGIFSWLIVPPLAALLTVPGFASIIGSTEGATLGWTYFWGLLWGIGGLTYGLGIRYLGMSLGNSILLGLTAAFGSLLPAIYYNLVPTEGKTSLSDMLAHDGGRMVLLGILVCLAGIAICGWGGSLKEKTIGPGTAGAHGELPADLGGKPVEGGARVPGAKAVNSNVAAVSADTTNSGVSEFNLRKGLTLAIISGVLSACFNYGIEAGDTMAAAAVSLNYNPLFQNNVTYVVLLWGGLTTNFLWCFYLIRKNKNIGNYTDRRKPLLKNFVLSAVAGTTWYLQFFFYGMGESKLGNGASSWILHMAFIILISNAWGLFLNEWKGAPKKALSIFLAGLATILLSVIIVGIGNSMN